MLRLNKNNIINYIPVSSVKQSLLYSQTKRVSVLRNSLNLNFNSIFRLLNSKSPHCLKPYFPFYLISKTEHLTRRKVELLIDDRRMIDIDLDVDKRLFSLEECDRDNCF